MKCTSRNKQYAEGVKFRSPGSRNGEAVERTLGSVTTKTRYAKGVGQVTQTIFRCRNDRDIGRSGRNASGENDSQPDNDGR
jgi:hypothetical protein